MAIVKVDPFRELAAMQDRMARLFGDVYLRVRGRLGLVQRLGAVPQGGDRPHSGYDDASSHE